MEESFKQESTIKAIKKTINGDPYRYVMMDTETGEIIDDAQGYGYKTPQKAYAAYNYKHGGGKKKHDAAKQYWKKNKEIAKFCTKWFECSFKELAFGAVSLKDLQRDIMEEFKVEVPLAFLKKL